MRAAKGTAWPAAAAGAAESVAVIAEMLAERKGGVNESKGSAAAGEPARAAIATSAAGVQLVVASPPKPAAPEKSLQQQVWDWETENRDKLLINFHLLDNVKLQVAIIKLSKYAQQILNWYKDKVNEFKAKTLPLYNHDYWLAFEASKIDEPGLIIAIITQAIKDEKLITKGYELNKKNPFDSKNSQGRPLLDMVIGNSHFVRVLVEGYGADVNARNAKKEPVIFRAAILGARASLIALRGGNGADVQAVDGNGENVLHHVVRAHFADGLKGRNLAGIAEDLVGWGVDTMLGGVDKCPLALARKLGQADLEIIFKRRMLGVIERYLGDSMVQFEAVTAKDIADNPDQVAQRFNAFNKFLKDHLRFLPDSRFVVDFEACAAKLYQPVFAVQRRYTSQPTAAHTQQPKMPSKVYDACNEVHRLLETIRIHGFMKYIAHIDKHGIAQIRLGLVNYLPTIAAPINYSGKYKISAFNFAAIIMEYYGEGRCIQGQFIIISYPQGLLRSADREVVQALRRDLINQIYAALCGSIIRSMFMAGQYNPADDDIRAALDEAIVDGIKVELSQDINLGKNHKDFLFKTKELLYKIRDELEIMIQHTIEQNKQRIEEIKAVTELLGFKDTPVVGFISEYIGDRSREEIFDSNLNSEAILAFNRAMQDEQLPSYKMLADIFAEIVAYQQTPKPSLLARIFGSSNTQQQSAIAF